MPSQRAFPDIWEQARSSQVLVSLLKDRGQEYDALAVQRCNLIDPTTGKSFVTPANRRCNQRRCPRCDNAAAFKRSKELTAARRRVKSRHPDFEYYFATAVLPDTGVENVGTATKFMMEKGRELTSKLPVYAGSYFQAELSRPDERLTNQAGLIHPHCHLSLFMPKEEGGQALSELLGANLGRGLALQHFVTPEKIASVIDYGTKSPFLSHLFPEPDDFAEIYDQLRGVKTRHWVN